MNFNSSWSEPAYLLSIILRSNKTVLVEGKTERDLLFAIANNDDLDTSMITIDTPDLFVGDNYSGLGNKTKILNFSKNLKKEDYDKKLYILIDREWDGLIYKNKFLKSWKHRKHKCKYIHYTDGHSIENYSFVVVYYLDYIKHANYGIYNLKRKKIIINNFSKILCLAAAVSEACLRFKCIKKIDGIFSVEDMKIENGYLILDDYILKKIQNRDIKDGNLLIQLINKQTIKKFTSSNFIDNIGKILHGHIGSQVIWTAIAFLMYHDGVDIKLANALAHGRKDEKKRFFYQWISINKPDNIKPIDIIISEIFY